MPTRARDRARRPGSADDRMSAFIMGVIDEPRVPAAAPSEPRRPRRRIAVARSHRRPRRAGERRCSSHRSICLAEPCCAVWASRGAAAARRDGAGRHRVGARRRRAGKTRLVCIEMVHGSAGATVFGARRTISGRRRRRARPSICRRPHERTRALSRLPDDHQQHRRAHGGGVRSAGDRRRPFPLERGVPDAGASQADAGIGRLRRTVDGSDLRAALRPGHADPVDAAVHREHRSVGRLRLRLHLRLHRHRSAGRRDAAAADGPRSARGLRSAVWLRRDARRTRRAPQGRPQRARLDHRRGRQHAAALGPSDRARLNEYLDDVREIERRIQKIETHNAAAKRASCRRLRPACPTISRSTSS